MHSPIYYSSRSGFRRVARLLAVLAVLTITVALRAQEYEVDGTIDLKLNHPDKSPWKDFQGNFRVYVSGCAWLIQITETNEWGIPQRREVGTMDGKEMYEMVVPYEPLYPADVITAGTNTGQIGPTGLVASNAIPVGNLDSSLTGHLWLMFASGCYFSTAVSEQLTPVFNWAATPYMNNHMTMKAEWELINGKGSLPSRVTYFGPDGTASGVYTATGFTNVGELTLPAGFHFSQPTGYKEVSAVVTAVRPTCSRDDLRPSIKQKLIMTDLRWHPDDLGGSQFTAYRADYWPTVKQAQEIYGSTHHAPKKVVQSTGIPFTTNREALMEKMQRAIMQRRDTPFASAIVDRPGVNLPEQGPWTVSETDLKQPLSLTMDLAQHKDPLFLFLWNSLSNETQSALQKKFVELSTPPGALYKAGPELHDLVTNLNELIQGRPVYDKELFAKIKPYLSGDTLKLLSQPGGADTARLNRLLLEDAFPLDIMRRPKILFDPDTNEYIVVDFAAKTASLYGKDGEKKWTAELGPSIDEESRRFPYFRNPGIPAGDRNVGLWNVSVHPGVLLFQVMANHIYGIDLSTGEIIALPHT